jgi:hypothetical protein
MKKTLLGIFAVASFSFATAQTNLGFEAWTAGAGYDNPDDWFTLNEFSAFGLPITVSKETAAPGGGSASVIMTTTLCAACPGLGIPDTLPGLISQDIPYTGTDITSIDFSYLYNAVAGDEAVFFAELTMWDGSQTITIADGAINLADQTTWSTMNVPLIYGTSDTPDTLSIVFASSIAVMTGDYSYPQSQFGSELKIDDIVFNGIFSVGLDELTLEGVNIYANENGIVINTEEVLANSTFEVYNIAGKLITSNTVSSTYEVVSTEGFVSGIYLVRLNTPQGITTKKVFLQ